MNYFTIFSLIACVSLWVITLILGGEVAVEVFTLPIGLLAMCLVMVEPIYELWREDSIWNLENVFYVVGKKQQHFFYKDTFAGIVILLLRKL